MNLIQYCDRIDKEWRIYQRRWRGCSWQGKSEGKSKWVLEEERRYFSIEPILAYLKNYLKNCRRRWYLWSSRQSCPVFIPRSRRKGQQRKEERGRWSERLKTKIAHLEKSKLIKYWKLMILLHGTHIVPLLTVYKNIKRYWIIIF